ncbi:MAG: cobalamin-independent methionine synthase II family protein, partial [Rhodospirillaceae bacterium]|nr:cobalamin-independent methionine synthase II family protein [Rhodospirillaceae bacterium]
MKLSTERILTTHVGSLPRPQDVSDMLLAKENETLTDQGAFDACMVSAVADVVRRQVDAGVDIVSDGEMSKSGYSTYVTERLHGFSGDSARKIPRDLELFPAFVQRVAAMGEAPQPKRAPCVGEISIKDEAPLRKDLVNMAAALDAAGAAEGFMNAASPGVIAFFQPNQYYPSEDAYLEVLGEAMRPEYEAIHAAGLVIQLDCPDLAMTRHSIHKDKSDAEFVAQAERNIEVLNHALENVPAEAARMHLCWGNYEGPHICDIALDAIYDVVMKAKPQAISFEAANPRHAHEWTVFAERGLPEDKVLIPGVIDSVSNFVEHPALVAERICRFADIVGRERVLAGA